MAEQWTQHLFIRINVGRLELYTWYFSCFILEHVYFVQNNCIYHYKFELVLYYILESLSKPRELTVYRWQIWSSTQYWCLLSFCVVTNEWLIFIFSHFWIFECERRVVQILEFSVPSDCWGKKKVLRNLSLFRVVICPYSLFCIGKKTSHFFFVMDSQLSHLAWVVK